MAASAPAVRPPAPTASNKAGVPAWKRSCEEYAGAPVEVTYQDGSGGATVIYRTKGNVAALRARTKEIAGFHNSGRRQAPALHDLYHLPHYAYVEELPAGAKLTLIPKSANPRQLVQQEVTNMRKHGCGRGQEAL